MGGLKCKMCGSNLDIEDSITVCKCEKCGTSQTVPDIEDDKELKLFERAGRLRFNCDFDKAAGIYNTITDSYPEEAEGYWGLILCKYGIEYVDNASGKKGPVCHRISYDSVMDDEDFELVMENSDSESRAIFREEAKIIEENRKKYIQIAESEQPYDIYISYRAKDDNGDKTAVSEIAGHLYNKLTSARYRVFLSEAALKGKKQSDCEPYIYSALNSANVMLALGTSYDDYNNVWVKNEWNRYLEIAEKNKNKCLIPCYKDVDEYDIPKEYAGLKVCQLGNEDTFNNIMAEIADVVKQESVNQPAPEPEKAEPAEEIELEEIEIIEPVDINKLLDEGFSAISDKNWKKANKLFFHVLDEEPDNSKAYWGQLLVQQASDKPADESNQDIHQISFPRYEDIKAECPDAKYQYLFTLDDTAFFRVALSHADKMHILEVTGGKFINRHYMRSAAPKEYVLAAITGFHLDGWYDKNHFCGRCANRLVEDDVERMLRCPGCGNMVYPRINPAVIVGVTNGDKLLLTKYNGREYKKYALVAGFNEIGESLEETVRREVMEETGLRVKNIRYYKSQPWGFTDNILAGYFCEVDGTDEIEVDMQELSVAKWVSREEIPASLEELSLTNEMISVFRLDKGDF